MNKVKSLSSLLLAVIVVSVTSCSSLKGKKDDKYADAWSNVLKSEDWKEALTASAEIDKIDYYGSEENAATVSEQEENTSPFDDKLEVLVKRAYIKIIAEAEAADSELEREFILHNALLLAAEDSKILDLDEKLQEVNKKFDSHRKMLEGLKSWKIFSQYGTDDIDFFKAENQKMIKDMMDKGQKESAIVSYLIYKLADLYHFES